MQFIVIGRILQSKKINENKIHTYSLENQEIFPLQKRVDVKFMPSPPLHFFRYPSTIKPIAILVSIG